MAAIWWHRFLDRTENEEASAIEGCKEGEVEQDKYELQFSPVRVEI